MAIRGIRLKLGLMAAGARLTAITHLAPYLRSKNSSPLAAPGRHRNVGRPELIAAAVFGMTCALSIAASANCPMAVQGCTLFQG
jgi:hypothetical protein